MKHQEPVKHALETKLDVISYLPRLWMVSLFGVLVTVVVLVAWPLAGASHRRLWTGGPLTNHHRLIEASCDKCHTSAFAAVTDEACTACHRVAEHTELTPSIVASHPSLALACTSCHREHHGKQTLVPEQSELCTGCHRELKALQPTHGLPTFDDLASHAELAIDVWSGDPPQRKRVPVGDPSARAPVQLKFSHALHLSLDEDGEPPPGCPSCHRESGGDLRPITFADNCQRCHALTYEDDALSFEVPHTRPDQIFRLIRAELSREQLRHAGARGAPAAAPTAETERHAEAAMFTEAGTCVQCHDVHAVPDAAEGASRFRIEAPRQGRVLDGARFTHESHRLSECERCHGGIRESRSAGDVLLPSIRVCQECHADPGVPSKINSPCLHCHGYHERKSEPARP